MLRIYLCIVFLLVEVAVISRSQNVDCEGLPDLVDIRARVQNLVNEAAGGEGNGLVAITDGPDYTCQVQGTLKGTYRELSAIVQYTLDGISPRKRQFELFCEDAGTGNIANNGWTDVPGSITTPTETNIPVFKNCSSCGAGNINRCQPCDPECNVGLMRCTGPDPSMCCVAFEVDGMCKTDPNCTTNDNFVANEQNDYTCACGLNSTSCDPGYIFNATDCSCVFNDICMTQPPPCNNGNCILNTAPDNFTCNCTGTGFMGTNCEVEIPLPSSSIVISSTVQEPSFVTSTTTTTPPSTTQAVTSTGSSTSVAPTATTLLQSDDGPYIPVIVASSIFGLLLIIILIILIIYIIYYLKSGNGFVVAKTKASAPFADGESHNNPLYLKPDDVVSEVATLYTP